MDEDEARRRLLDAAGRLFYARGIQAVGMDEIRAASGVSLKRLYRCFPSKQDLVEGYLRQRDTQWRAALAAHVARHSAGPADTPAAVFDWLGGWLAGPDFRGCAFLNAHGELGGVDDRAARAVRDHKQAVHDYLTGLLRPLPVADPGALAGQLLLLVDGAISAAAVTGDPAVADRARAAAEVLLSAVDTADVSTAAVDTADGDGHSRAGPSPARPERP